jgi:hypothetical protein
MKTQMLRAFLVTGAILALAPITTHAQVIELRATINGTQETPANSSPATGMAIMLYDIGSNTFDLTVTVNNLSNLVAASHIHEAAMGVAGPVVTPLGNETVYTRNGTTVTATFTSVAYAGTPLTLLQNGAYINLHSGAFPGGEVRGQLIAQPKRLVAVLTGPQDGPTNTSTAYGAAMITYDPGTNKISTRLNIYNFVNTLANSHYHEAPMGSNGPVVHGLGGASVYTQTGTSYGASFNSQTYLGNPLKLLTGGTYLNVHSNVYPGGEIRGQVQPSDELNTARIVNIAARGWVGTGDQVLISGFVITGTEPVRVLITARGPSLTAFGVAGALADPKISLHDSSGRELVVNDNMATTFSAGDLASTTFAPTDPNESALLLVLPPGSYSTVVSGVGGTTGVALTEVYEVRPMGTPAMLLAQEGSSFSQRRLHPLVKMTPASARRTQVAPKFCIATPASFAANQ